MHSFQAGSLPTESPGGRLEGLDTFQMIDFLAEDLRIQIPRSFLGLLRFAWKRWLETSRKYSYPKWWLFHGGFTMVESVEKKHKNTSKAKQSLNIANFKLFIHNGSMGRW